MDIGRAAASLRLCYGQIKRINRHPRFPLITRLLTYFVHASASASSLFYRPNDERCDFFSPSPSPPLSSPLAFASLRPKIVSGVCDLCAYFIYLFYYSRLDAPSLPGLRSAPGTHRRTARCDEHLVATIIFIAPNPLKAARSL